MLIKIFTRETESIKLNPFWVLSRVDKHPLQLVGQLLT